MMEKRNFVTSARTPMDCASGVDDVVMAGVEALGRNMRKTSDGDAFAKTASAEDEKTDSCEG